MDALYDLLAQPPTAYLILFAIAAGDAVFPALPSESAAILAGVLAAIEPGIALPAVLGAAAFGAFVGDSTSYGLGRYGGRRAQRRFFDRPSAQRGMQWASMQLRLRGAVILLVARFVPGGRTGATFTSGLTKFHYGRFALFTGIAACLWALYAVLLGYFGGRIFHERPLLAFGVAFGLAALIAAASVVVRRVFVRVRRAPAGDAEDSPGAGAAPEG